MTPTFGAVEVAGLPDGPHLRAPWLEAPVANSPIGYVWKLGGGPLGQRTVVYIAADAA